MEGKGLRAGRGGMGRQREETLSRPVRLFLRPCSCPPLLQPWRGTQGLVRGWDRVGVAPWEAGRWGLQVRGVGVASSCPSLPQGLKCQASVGSQRLRELPYFLTADPCSTPKPPVPPVCFSSAWLPAGFLFFSASFGAPAAFEMSDFSRRGTGGGRPWGSSSPHPLLPTPLPSPALCTAYLPHLPASLSRSPKSIWFVESPFLFILPALSSPVPPPPHTPPVPFSNGLVKCQSSAGGEGLPSRTPWCPVPCSLLFISHWSWKEKGGGGGSGEWGGAGEEFSCRLRSLSVDLQTLSTPRDLEHGEGTGYRRK